MTVRFPKGYVCPEEYRNKWPAIEAEMLPLIKAKARKIKRWYHGIEYDDAVQEGRLALLCALPRYEAEKGPMFAYIGAVLDNAYRQMMYEATLVSRMPRAIFRVEGEKIDTYVRVPIPPLSLDSMLDYSADGKHHRYLCRGELACTAPNPEDVACDNELEGQAAVFRMRLMNRLDGRDKLVFECRTNPPIAFLKTVQNMGGDINNPTNLHIAEYLGVDKNAVDFSLWKIKGLFVKMIKDNDFIELFGDIVYKKGWPMVHVSKKTCHDTDFVGQVISKRKLDPKPIKNYHNKKNFYQRSADGRYARMIEKYEWGCVLVVKNGCQWRTIVVEGKLSVLTGEVSGEGGVREKIPVDWYCQLSKELHKCQPKQ